MLRKTLLLIVILAGLILFISAAKIWEKKPYTEWNEKDARSILESSPWSATFIHGTVPDIGGQVTGRSSNDIPSEREVQTIVRVSLFSSHPIRQALMMMVVKGDSTKLTDRMKTFITREISDEIILSWNVTTRPPSSIAGDIERELRTLNLAQLANNTFLATNEGKKVFIKDYILPSQDGTGPKFVFPRTLPDGTPLITEKTKSLRFQTKEFRMKEESVPIDATFKVQDLQYQGKLDY